MLWMNCDDQNKEDEKRHETDKNKENIWGAFFGCSDIVWDVAK